MRERHDRSRHSRGGSAGFTLIELLIVVVILGILAAIALINTRAVQVEAYRTTVKTDLRNLALQEELFEKTNYRYATLAELTEFVASDGVTVDLGWAGNDGFAATASHASLPGTTCGYFVGDPPGDEAGPATVAGDVVCD